MPGREKSGVAEAESPLILLLTLHDYRSSTKTVICLSHNSFLNSLGNFPGITFSIGYKLNSKS